MSSNSGWRRAIVAVLVLNLVACGGVMVRSSPHGAEIYVDGVPTGKVTPAKVSVPFGEHEISVGAPGFEASPPQLVWRTTSIAAIVWTVLLPVPFLFIYPWSGWSRVDPEAVGFELKPQTSSPAPQAPPSDAAQEWPEPAPAGR